MTVEIITSAGRLAHELHYLRNSFNNGGVLHQKVVDCFSRGEVHWSRGLQAYFKLVDDVEADLVHVQENRRPVFVDALERFRGVFDPARFNDNSQSVAKNYLSETFVVRIEGLADVLEARGASISLDRARASEVSGKISQLIEDIENSVSTEVDDFLISKLSELKWVLDRYILFGAGGVEDAVSMLVGGLNIAASRQGGLSDAAKIRAKSGFELAKAAVDVFVYAHSGVEAIQWAGETLALAFKG